MGFLLAYLAILGIPAFPPVASVQKLAALVLAGLVAGLVLDGLRDPVVLRWPPIVAGPAVALYWLALPRLAQLEATTVLILALLCAASLIVLVRLEGVRKQPGLAAPVMLGFGALGVALIAFLAHSASIAQLAFALAAAIAGFGLWNWPRPRYRFGMAALLGGAGALLGLVAVLVLYSRASPIALALLLPIFFADIPARRIRLGSGLLASALEPVLLAGLSLVPLIAALGVAYAWARF